MSLFNYFILFRYAAPSVSSAELSLKNILQVAVILEDTVFENGVMDGKNAPFGKFAGSLRQKLMQEHLAFDTVKDCISETFYKDIWLRRASINTKLYEEIFDCFPSDKVIFKI